MKSAFEKHIGSKLKYCRILRGLSQADLGREVGLSAQQIQKYEWGTSRLSIQWAYNLTQVLKFNLDELIPGDHYKSLSDFAEDYQLTKSPLLMRYFKKLDLRHQDIVLKLVKDLARE